MVDIDYFRKRQKLIELRYNPYHDPSNGRFTSGGGGGGGFLYSPNKKKGEKGMNGDGSAFYVAPETMDKGEKALADGEYEKWQKEKVDNSKVIPGIKGAAWATYSEVEQSSPNDIWADTPTPHGLFHNEELGTVRVRGDKKDKLALLNAVNSATVHLRGIDPKNYTQREVNWMNKKIQEIKKLGFDTPLINAAASETVIYAKRILGTKSW